MALPLTPHQQELRDQLTSLWVRVHRALTGQPLPEADLRHTILFQLTGAAHRLIRGFLAQLDGGSVDGGEGILRPLLEATINIVYILDDPTEARARAFVIDDLRSRRAASQRLYAIVKNDMPPSQARTEAMERHRASQVRLDQELRAYKEAAASRGESAEWPRSLEEVARLGNTTELYATAYWLLSHDQHLTARGLDRFTQEVDGSIYFDLEENLGRLDNLLLTAYMHYLALLNECSSRVGLPAHSLLEEYDDYGRELICQQEA